MNYRPFGKTNFAASALGFGCMRLPIIGQSQGKIDEQKAIKMIRYAADQGVNYFDTAYSYHEGQSEIILGKALKDGYREKVKIATKLPSWLVNHLSDFDKYLHEQLKKLQTDQIDFYLLHNLNQAHWPKLRGLNIFKKAEKAIQDGRIGYLGFSFHDSFELFKEIVDAYQWTFCQIQYNFMDEDFQAGKKGLHYATSKGLAVVVMEPLKGGKLALPPVPVQKIWDSALVDRTPVDWALQWVWDQPEVTLALSGMSTLGQVKENLASASRSAPNSLNAEEKTLIKKVKETYEKLSPIPCTGCQYCLPCQSGVNIPKIFTIYNDAITYGTFESGKGTYQKLAETERADKCTECGKCEKLCPQGIQIRPWLKTCRAFLSP